MKEDQDHCKGLMGLLGHKFKARYDTSSREGAAQYPVPSVMEEIARVAIITDENVSAILDSTCEREDKSTYVHDICVRCGKIVRREEKV